MFCYECLQKGCYCQFYQIGVEVFGLQGLDIDVELIMLIVCWWCELGIFEYVSLELNFIGLLEVCVNYCDVLVVYLEQFIDKLDEDSKCWMYINLLWVLDFKNLDVQVLFNDVLVFGDYFDEELKVYFVGLCVLFDDVGICYIVNQCLVCGFDYYNCIVFEWVIISFGFQGIVCVGGCYDGLVEQLGGCVILGVGFVMGLECFVLLVQVVNLEFKVDFVVDIYLVVFGIDIQFVVMCLVEQVCDVLFGVKLMINYGGGNFKKQFVCVDKWGVCVVLVVGELEIVDGNVVVKDLCLGE